MRMSTKVYCVSLITNNTPKHEREYKTVYTNAPGFAEAAEKVQAAYPEWAVTGVSFEDDFFLV